MLKKYAVLSKKQKWFKEVFYSESEINKGIAGSTDEGVTEII
jgi:hypothetical protein